MIHIEPRLLGKTFELIKFKEIPDDDEIFVKLLLYFILFI